MDLSIIIVNWNSADYLRACLRSIYRETKGLSFEVIVVDNASGGDDCFTTLVNHGFPGVRLFCCKENIGFGRASNLGHQMSTGDILVFLNPDTEIHDNVFFRLVQHLRSRPEAGAVGARLLNSDGSVQSSCIQAFPTIANQLLDAQVLRDRFPKWRLWGSQPLWERGEHVASVDAISGACLVVRRDVFAKVGEFDSRYFMYVEDLDLCYRIAQAGLAIHYLDSCEVTHHGGKSSAQQEKGFVNLRQQQALLQFFQATRGRYYAYAYRVALTMTSVMRLLLILAVMPFRRDPRAGVPWTLSFEKWCRMFRWAMGFEAQARR